MERYAAAVAWDDYGLPPATLRPRIPTLMFQSEEQGVEGPWLPAPDPRRWVEYRITDGFTAAHVPHALLALRGSTHQEWSYIPYSAANPLAPLTNSSRYGGQVSLHETVAWFDRYLKSGPESSAGGARLLARTLDASTDLSSRGQGSYDAVRQRNAPYHVAGLKLGEQLSRTFASEIAFDGRNCRDWQSGC